VSAADRSIIATLRSAAETAEKTAAELREKADRMEAVIDAVETVPTKRKRI
jgi:hypothetical protein